jgi:hypothetical protein
LRRGEYLVFHAVVVVGYVEAQPVVEELAFKTYFVFVLLFGADIGISPRRRNVVPCEAVVRTLLVDDVGGKLLGNRELKNKTLE